MKRTVRREAKSPRFVAPRLVIRPRNGMLISRITSIEATPGKRPIVLATVGENVASEEASPKPIGRTNKSALSVSFAQATTVVRNEPIRIATATVIAIAIISEATATLFRTGDEPGFAAAISPAAEREAKRARATR